MRVGSPHGPQLSPAHGGPFVERAAHARPRGAPARHQALRASAAAGAVARPRLLARLRGGRPARASRCCPPPPASARRRCSPSGSQPVGEPPGRPGCRSTPATTTRRASCAYVIAALQRRRPGASARTPIAALRRPPRRRPSRCSPRCSTSSPSSPDDVVLVLDDYHVIESPRRSTTRWRFLLEHLPPRCTWSSPRRADPPLPLPRLRARGELVEIRAADLRFTRRRGRRLPQPSRWACALPRADVAALEERTEGWIAGLQLAALSLQGRDDLAGFIAGFAGDDRFVARLPGRGGARTASRADVQAFLLETSVLDRLTGAAVRRGHRAGRRRRRCWTRSSGPTSSSSRSTTGAAGIATTTCSPTSCART